MKSMVNRHLARILCAVLTAMAIVGFSSCGMKYDEPPFTVRNLKMATGTTPPAASDFLTSVSVKDNVYKIAYEKNYDFDAMNASPATYELTLIFSDTRGYVTSTKVQLTIGADTTPPVITQVDFSAVTVGDTVAYKQRVTVCDDCIGDVTLTVDSSAVNLKSPGTYPVTYQATDASGNTTTLKTAVNVVPAESAGLDTLNAALDAVIAQIITPDMDREAQLRAVYRYVYDNIAYASTSEKDSWVDEAYHALFVSHQGDCFSYFAGAKAFCERLGIENMDVQRLAGYTENTHYWSMVNLGGTGTDARWYHFDCCHLQAEYNHSGCLLTDRQVDAYNKARPHFYEYDKSAYPKTPSEILTATPALEPFYN